jgi:hypothetical protein
MSTISSSKTAIAVIRRNTEEVQSCGNFEVFEEIFDDDWPFLGIAPTHRKIHLESVDVMHVRKGKITDHLGGGKSFLPGAATRSLKTLSRWSSNGKMKGTK